MLNSISVSAGSEPCTEAAQRHAFSWARQHGARLRILGAWDGEPGMPASESAEKLAQREVESLETQAGAQGVAVSSRVHGSGFEEALLSEARASDLLVVGLPADGVATDGLGEALLKAELPVLRRAESCVLVVSEPPPAPSLRRVLVNYQGGMEGKTALRLAGAVATAHDAEVSVLSVAGDPASATALTEVAEDYLDAFGDLPVHSLEHKGTPDSEGRILDSADEVDADLIVIGAEPSGFLDRFLHRDVAEQVAMATSRPLLLAR